MQSKTKFNLWYAVLAMLAILMLQNLFGQTVRVEQIPYSQFQAYLADNRVEEVRIGQNRIQGKLKNAAEGEAQHFITVRVDKDLADSLSAYHVRFAGEIESTFLRDLLSWVVPVLLFGGLWMFLMRRFSQGGGLGGGFMAIGKNKAKIYMDQDVQVTFADAAGVDEAKAELEEVVSFLQTPEKFRR
ncbi:MAG: ATP-dependent metallopeptidase FtsH/Yme1/Tma family protein, partial [Candidatus Tectomicrobia bacterium]|nr:ATP-dependent metallopeptidase FtsH/Yme1/Tma family protein [Candidatus Tectomicrobia bacterium]